uniref:Uncharacterized protein n=1 Tax=Arundo donax TaxID=35708 RepID=A0A0A8Y592_ARUDO
MSMLQPSEDAARIFSIIAGGRWRVLIPVRTGRDGLRRRTEGCVRCGARRLWPWRTCRSGEGSTAVGWGSDGKL